MVQQKQLHLYKRTKIILAIVSGMLFLFFGVIGFFVLAMLGFSDSPPSPRMVHAAILKVVLILLIPLTMTILMYIFAYISNKSR